MIANDDLCFDDEQFFINEEEDQEELDFIFDEDETQFFDDAEMLFPINLKQPRIFRKRWDSAYLRNLAENENSFLAEYRVDPASFDILVNMLGDSLDVNNEMAAKGSSVCGIILERLSVWNNITIYQNIYFL